MALRIAVVYADEPGRPGKFESELVGSERNKHAVRVQCPHRDVRDVASAGRDCRMVHRQLKRGRRAGGAHSRPGHDRALAIITDSLQLARLIRHVPDQLQVWLVAWIWAAHKMMSRGAGDQSDLTTKNTK